MARRGRSKKSRQLRRPAHISHAAWRHQILTLNVHRMIVAGSFNYPRNRAHVAALRGTLDEHAADMSKAELRIASELINDLYDADADRTCQAAKWKARGYRCAAKYLEALSG